MKKTLQLACIVLLVSLMAGEVQFAKAEITYEITKFTFFTTQKMLPKDISFESLQALTTKGVALHILIGSVDHCQQYRISIVDSFWKRLWLSMSNMFRNIRIDFRKKPDVANLEKIANANIWGISTDGIDFNGKITGLQLLKLESMALSEILIRNGIPRTLNEEIDYLKKQVKLVENDMIKRFKSLGLNVKNGAIDENWLYYIFALNHNLLPNWATKASDLGKDLTLSQALDFLLKAIGYCKQMAHDLEK